jgi:Fic family protein
MLDLAQISTFAAQSSKFFGRLGEFRNKYDLDFDDVLLFLALGQLNFGSNLGAMFLEPTNISSISNFLGIPRETARRKLYHLAEHNLVRRSNNGFVVTDIPAWCSVAELLFNS